MPSRTATTESGKNDNDASIQVKLHSHIHKMAGDDEIAVHANGRATQRKNIHKIIVMNK